MKSEQTQPSISPASIPKQRTAPVSAHVTEARLDPYNARPEFLRAFYLLGQPVKLDTHFQPPEPSHLVADIT